MPSHATVGVNDDLTTCEPSVPHRTAYHEPSSGIDVVFGVCIEQMLRNCGLDDLLQHFGAQTPIVHGFGMLRRDHDRVDAHRLVIGIVFNCDLGFAVRPEEIERTILANF